jgi:PAS domain S-box-containing protein
VSNDTSTSPPGDQVLAAALRAAAVPVAVMDRSGRLTWINDAVVELTGYTREEFTSTTIADRVSPEDRAPTVALLERLAHGEFPRDRIGVRWVRKDGETIRVEWRFSLLRDAAGTVTHIVAVGLDVTERTALETARHAADERFRLSFDRAPVGMWLTRADDDHRGVILSLNRAMCRLLGYAEDDLIGRTIWDVTHPDDAAHERRWVDDWLARGGEGVFPYEKRFTTASGETIWAALHLSLISREPGNRVFLSHVIDITDRKVAEQTTLAGSVDPLTGLLTEAAFLRDLRVTLAEDRPLSVVRMQLLPASDVRAVHGHEAADELVQRGAGGLAALLPDDTRLARTGSDQFATFLKATGRESVQIARDARARMSAEAASAAPGAVAVSIAAGVAACDPGEEEVADTLYASAGAALEDAVRSGTGIALSGRDARERAGKRLRWERRMRETLDEAGFVVYGQPVCRLDTGAVQYTELSLRMLDEDGRLVFPSVFLPVAENSGLILEIDRWLLRRTITLLKAHPGGRFAIRLSAVSVIDRRAGEIVAGILAEDPDAARRLIVEIVGAEAPLAMRRTVERIRARGSQILLLNFGLAFGSLHHARTLPITAIKIHGSFVRGADQDVSVRHVIKAVADMARFLGVATIAELVESAELAAALRDAGVDYGQGFFFGRPSPVA